MAFFVGQELLMTKLDDISLVLVDIVLVLVNNLYDLIVLLKHHLRALDLSLLIKIRENEQLVKGNSSSELGHI
jgi:hypothetical protein